MAKRWMFLLGGILFAFACETTNTDDEDDAYTDWVEDTNSEDSTEDGDQTDPQSTDGTDSQQDTDTTYDTNADTTSVDTGVGTANDTGTGNDTTSIDTGGETDSDTESEPVSYNVYYGMLHSHTNISDGTGSPEKAYKYARDTANLDFFSIADHDYWPDDMTEADWKEIKDAANKYNQDGAFVTFWGFEWTSDSKKYQESGLGLGHIAVINSDEFCISTYEPTRTLNGLTAWLETQPDAFAFFNHPGQYDTTFDKFKFNYTEQIVGMELWNRDSGFSYYYNNGYYLLDGGLGYYDEAIQRGFYLGASGSDDNHEGTWGTINDYRMAVLAPAKTRASLYDAIKARRFYSTADKNLELSFTINGEPMGSKIAAGPLDIAIEASDGDDETFENIRLLKNGERIKRWTPGAKDPSVSWTADANKGDYFYVIVKQNDNDEAISSPIYITQD